MCYRHIKTQMEPMEAAMMFLETCKQTQSEVNDLAKSLDAIKSRIIEARTTRSLQIEKLRKENKELESKINLEEQWIKRAAINILNSDQQFLVVLFQTIWELSKYEDNMTEIVNEESMRSFVDYLLTNPSEEVKQGIYGILGNIIATEVGIEFFRGFTEMLEQILFYTKNLLEIQDDPTKTSVYAIIFCKNTALAFASMLVGLGFVPMIASSIERYKIDFAIDAMVDLALTISIAEKIPADEQLLLENAVRQQSPLTSPMIQLLTNFKTAFE